MYYFPHWVYISPQVADLAQVRDRLQTQVHLPDSKNPPFLLCRTEKEIEFA